MRFSFPFFSVVTIPALFAVRCGSNNYQSSDYAPPDSGSMTAMCVFDSDCAQGSCVNGQCVVCPATPCPSGMVCGANGQCTSCSTNCASDAGTTSCTTRSNCPSNEVCASGVCQPPGPTCQNTDGCLQGQVCDNGKCYAGNCVTNLDCSGNASGPICNTTTHQCGPCTADSQCQTMTAPGNYCDTQTGQCTWGCLPSPNCGTNCCSTGTCDTTTHQCSTTCDCTTVMCSPGQACDPTTCQCTGGTSGGGDGGSSLIPCTAGCSCPNPTSQVCLDFSFTGQCPNSLAFCI
jgi:hypothetical protein